MDIQYLLECILEKNVVSNVTKHGLKEQKGGLHFIAYMLVQILTFVFSNVLVPLVQLIFQLPSFYKEEEKEITKMDDNGNYLDAEGNPLPEDHDESQRVTETVKTKKFRTKFGFIPYPEYTPELEGTGYFWRFLKACIKFSIGIVIGALGGIYLVLGGMVYLIARIFRDFTEKPRSISKKIDTQLKNQPDILK